MSGPLHLGPFIGHPCYWKLIGSVLTGRSTLQSEGLRGAADGAWEPVWKVSWGSGRKRGHGDGRTAPDSLVDGLCVHRDRLLGISFAGGRHAASGRRFPPGTCRPFCKVGPSLRDGQEVTVAVGSLGGWGGWTGLGITEPFLFTISKDENFR